MKTETKKGDEQRTGQQNKALHVLFRQVSDEMIASGKGMHVALTALAAYGFNMPVTPAIVKEIWRDIQIAATGKTSTADLTKNEIDLVYERFVLVMVELKLPITFPSFEALAMEREYGKLTPRTHAK